MGDIGSYDLTITDPYGTRVDWKFIRYSQMVDGKQSVWMRLVGHLEQKVEAKLGAYWLVVTDSRGNIVYEGTLGPYSGSNLSVIDIGTISTSYIEYAGGYDIDLIPLTVKNTGDLPAFISRVTVTIDTEKDHSNIPDDEVVVLPGETATIRPSFPYLGPFEEGYYSAFIELTEGRFGRGKTIATYTTTIYIP